MWASPTKVNELVKVLMDWVKVTLQRICTIALENIRKFTETHKLDRCPLVAVHIQYFRTTTYVVICCSRKQRRSLYKLEDRLPKKGLAVTKYLTPNNKSL